MGCRQSKPKHQQDPLPLINMLIVGLAGSGKSTIINQLKGQPQAICNEELGIDSFVINQKLRFIAFEVAGRAISSWHNYYSTSNIVLFVIDSNQPENFPKIKQILSEMDRQLDPKSKIILIFNKIDLFITKQTQPINQQTSHITQKLQKNINLNQVNNFKVVNLTHEIFMFKCSGKNKIGLNPLLKKIYALALNLVFGQELA